MCRVLGVSTSEFCAWRTTPVSDREERNRDPRKKVREAFEESRGTYESPCVHRELRENGDVVSTKKVAKLMREERLVARRKKRFRATTDSKHEDPIAPNLVNRDFRAPAPNDTWVTDVTCIWTREGWLVLAALIDLYSRRVVGWATSANNDRVLALDALRDALTKPRPAPGLVHHSDRGSPYARDDCREELRGWDFVVRFRQDIHVTSAAGETKPAREWLSRKGHSKAMRGTLATAKQYEVGAVVTVHAPGMKDS